MECLLQIRVVLRGFLKTIKKFEDVKCNPKGYIKANTTTIRGREWVNFNI